MSDIPGLAARRAALMLLDGVLHRQRSTSDMADDPKGPLSRLDPPQKARAAGLANGVLRHLTRIDTLIGRFAQRPPIGDAALALRIAAYEMLHEDIPPHAAVDSAVRLAGNRKAAGFVNAVGRRIGQDGRAIWDILPPGSAGAWLGPRIKATYGKAALRDIARAHEAGAPLDLTPRDPAQVADLAARLDGTVLPTGSIRLPGGAQVSSLPGYDSGAWWVQDAAAAMPVQLLGDIQEMTVLDLCAAPGGKTLQLAARGAHVTAVDASAHRLERLAANLDRTGLAAEIVTADARTYAPGRTFDVVVLDAPCSATGTLRRHPDIPHVRAEPDLRPLLSLQAALIDRAVDWLTPGGRLLYCVCSLLPEEGEVQASDALARHDSLARAPIRPEKGIDPAWITADGDLRLRPDFLPDSGGMDGFFASVLRRGP